MNKPVLVVMAAGMGSRFGGLKQLEPIDDNGHVILDYTVYDAHRAGFDTVIIQPSYFFRAERTPELGIVAECVRQQQVIDTDGSVIGGSVWLTHSVPAGSKVYNKQ